MTRFISIHRCLQPVVTAIALLAFAALAPVAGADEARTVAQPPAVATAAAAADTQAPDAAPADPTAAETATAVDFSGMIVHIDPKTGRMRPPTPEETAELSRALARRMEISSASAAAHSEEHLANGAVMIELDPAFHDFTVGRRAADGTLVTDCVHGAEIALEVVKTPVEAPAAREVQ